MIIYWHPGNFGSEKIVRTEYVLACVAGAKRGERGRGGKARKRGKGRERLL